MTASEFTSLNPGDFVYHPAEPDNIWTVIGRQFQYDSILAIRGRCNIGNQHLWIALLQASEERCRDLAKRYGLEVTRMINPGNWEKEKTSGK